ncbi:MAG: glutathione binding-like protein [Gammaproteobacteria bacterium]
MSSLVNRRSVMTLYADAADPIGHAVRIVLAEKDVNVEIAFVTDETKPDDLHDYNPYHTLLTLIDRDLVLYDAQIMLEYLDERYPHPPLMPVDPVSRANNRQIRYRITRDLLAQTERIARGDADAADARRAIGDNLHAIAPALNHQPYFLSDEYTLVDCCFAPLLWRLPHYGVKLSAQAKSLLRYADKLFAREAFRASLSAAERAMRS